MEKLKIKKIILNTGLSFVLLMLILPSAPVFGAEEEYTLLAQLPCIDGSGSGESFRPDCSGLQAKTTLEKYLPGLFNLMIGIAGVFAVLMIVIGGFQYMSTDALQGKEDGKTRIWNSVKGLVLVISAWLILDTVNPALLKLNLNIEKITIAPPAGSGGALAPGGSAPYVPLTDADITESNARRTYLRTAVAKESGTIETYAGACTIPGKSTECVNLNGLSDQMENSLIGLRVACYAGCNMTITGGTEGGHSGGSSHNTGNAIDLRFDQQLDRYIITNGGEPVQTSLGPRYTVNIKGKNVTFLRESNPDHWHMQ